MINEREHTIKAKQNLLCSLFDKLEHPDKGKENFKKQYLSNIQLTQNLRKEAFVVNQLSKIVENKDFEGIENIFNLYTVMKQERLLLGTKYMLGTGDLPFAV